MEVTKRSDQEVTKSTRRRIMEVTKFRTSFKGIWGTVYYERELVDIIETLYNKTLKDFPATRQLMDEGGFLHFSVPKSLRNFLGISPDKVMGLAVLERSMYWAIENNTYAIRKDFLHRTYFLFERVVEKYGDFVSELRHLPIFAVDRSVLIVFSEE